LIDVAYIRVVEWQKIVHFGAILRRVKNIVELGNLVCALNKIDCFSELFAAFGLGEPFVKEIVRF